MATSLTAPAVPKELDEEFDARFEALHAKVDASRQQRERIKIAAERAQDSDAKAAKGLGIGLTIAYTILGMPLIGYGLGWLLDRELNTLIWKGFGVLLGAVVGVWYALVMLARTNKEL